MQYVFTIIAIAGVTNAFNLIDGIDGLAGGLSLISLVSAGALLSISGDHFFALLAFAMAGGVAGFLFFNYYPAKIFMGDTGSLVIGFMLAVLSIRIMQVYTIPVGEINNIPVIALSLVLIPVFDTLRVFLFRILRGKSAFSPDKTHIHHLLTNAGYNHGLVARLICFFHSVVLLQVILFSRFDQELVLLTSIALVTLITLAFKTIGERRILLLEKHYKFSFENIRE
jgi:UDP-N-acetylmuramyl pentapeptide phosphotransferase/UDP-N-acetylglucosamine-1-phosphate transferase